MNDKDKRNKKKHYEKKHNSDNHQEINNNFNDKLMGDRPQIIDNSKQINELKENYIRLQAEFDNYHKRTDKEIERLKKTANKSS